MTSRLSSPLFVGRTAELDELHQALDAANAGALRVVLVSGEAGVGKTRLLREFSNQARSAGSRVAAGAALPFGEDGPPYAPIVDALRRLRRELALERLADFSASDAGGLLSSPTEASVPAESQAALFESVLSIFERLAVDETLVLLVEDLHWADRSTRDLLTYVARLASGRILIVASYRSEEIDEVHPLAGVMAELERSGIASRLEVSGLSAQDVAQMLTGIVGGSVDEATVARVIERSQGNPFFAEELLAAERASPGAELPPLVRQVVLDRVRRLPENAQAILRVVAAFGHQATYAHIAAATALEETDLIEALRQAVRHAVLRPRHDAEQEAFAFRHPLVREAVYGDTLPGERTRIHRRIAEGLATSLPGDHDPGVAREIELAYHWDLAHDPAKAFEASVRAGVATARSHAHAAAHRHLERALTLWDRLGSHSAAAISSLDRVELIERSADAAAAIGEHASAVQRLEEAVALRKEAGNLELVSQLYVRLGRLWWSAGDDAASMGAYDQALACLPRRVASPSRARAMAAKASGLMVRARYRESLKLAEAALAMARKVGSAADEAYAANVAGMDLAYLDQPEKGIEYLERARRLAQERGDHEELRQAFVNLTSALHRAGRRHEAVELAFEAAATAGRMGLERTWGRVQLVNAAVGLYDLGRWEEAVQLCQDALTRGGNDLVACYFELVSAQLATDQGRTDAAVAHLAAANRLAAGVADPVLVASVEATAAELATWRADLPAVRTAVDRGLGLLEGSDERPLQARLIVIALAAESDAVAVARARRDSTALNEARTRCESLLGVAGELAGHGETYADREIDAYLQLARAHAARIHDDLDPGPWRAASSAWGALEQPYQAAMVAWRAADALLAVRASRDEAALLLRGAHQTAERLAAAPLLREVDLLARRARIELTPPATKEPVAVSAVAQLGLTAREEEVLGLVAMGMTNRQIAESLFISEKTASVHVSNILGKLGVGSRVEAAGVAFRLGLLSGPMPTEAGDADVAEAGADVPSLNEVSRAFMFTDITRSTDLVEAIGDGAWTELLRWHDATLRSLFTTYGGEEVDHAGDGFFVVFHATQAALGCAVAIQRTLAAHRRAHGFAPSVRIGLHRSRVQQAQGAYRGRGVHEAARIAGLADPDEILISRDSLSGGRLSFETLTPRDVELKGIRGKVTVVPVSWR